MRIIIIIKSDVISKRAKEVQGNNKKGTARGTSRGKGGKILIKEIRREREIHLPKVLKKSLINPSGKYSIPIIECIEGKRRRRRRW